MWLDINVAEVLHGHAKSKCAYCIDAHTALSRWTAASTRVSTNLPPGPTHKSQGTGLTLGLRRDFDQVVSVAAAPDELHGVAGAAVQRGIALIFALTAAPLFVRAGCEAGHKVATADQRW